MIVRFVIWVAPLLVLLPLQLSAQGVFEGFSLPGTVISTGHTEALSPMNLTLRQGSVAGDTLVIDVSPLRITNGSASDIRVTSSGTISAGATVLEAEQGRVRIPVNAGGISGGLRVEGIRVSLPGTAASSVNARLSWERNQNLFREAGSAALTTTSSVLVVNRVESGLVANPMTDGFVIFNNRVFDDRATIAVRESFSSAFTSSTEFGQNTPTQVRIRVTDLPAGLKMRFPASVTANESGATLTTVEGAAVDLPRSSGSANVIYSFNGTADSVALTESFNVQFTVSVEEALELLQPTIEVSLFPIGSAKPGSPLPSTAIPRFGEENLTVLEGTSKIITKTSYWTGIDGSRENRITLFNPSSRVSNITFTAFDPEGRAISGPNVNNPVLQPLGSNQSTDQSLQQIFGSGASNVATVRVQSTGSDVIALGTSGSAGLLESTPLLTRGTSNFVVPVLNEGDRLHLFNPSSASVSGTLRLLTSRGEVIGPTTVSLAPMASVSRSIEDLFGTQLEGQIAGSFQSSVIAFESFGRPNALNFIPVQPAAGVESLYVPFFAAGGGYETDINLINSSDQTVTLTAQLFDTQGERILSTRLITMSPSDQLSITASQLFQLQGPTVGYVRFQVPQSSRAFFTFYPSITGYVRIRSGQQASTVIPISGHPLQDSFLLNSGVAGGQFQGIALVNPGSATVNVTLQAIGANGTVLETASATLGAGQISSKLTTEYFTVAVPERSVIRVTGSAPIIASSITGSTNGDSLRSVPALR